MDSFISDILGLKKCVPLRAVSSFQGYLTLWRCEAIYLRPATCLKMVTGTHTRAGQRCPLLKRAVGHAGSKLWILTFTTVVYFDSKQKKWAYESRKGHVYKVCMFTESIMDYTVHTCACIHGTLCKYTHLVHMEQNSLRHWPLPVLFLCQRNFLAEITLESADGKHCTLTCSYSYM